MLSFCGEVVDNQCFVLSDGMATSSVKCIRRTEYKLIYEGQRCRDIYCGGEAVPVLHCQYIDDMLRLLKNSLILLSRRVKDGPKDTIG